MHRCFLRILLFSIPLLPDILTAETNSSDYLSHAIPSNADRFGPMEMRGGISHYYYYWPNVVRVNSNIVAREAFHKQVRLERELYKNGKKHGIQLEWFRNGQLKSEAPYRDGLMHGTCKHWDETGKLIGQYVMANGAGTKRIYHSNGQLHTEDELRDNRYNGLRIAMFTNGHVQSIGWWTNDLSPRGFSFYQNGDLHFIAWHPGPALFFGPDGSAREKMWRTRARDLSEAEYAKAAAEDSSLPPYYKDASRYKDFVDDKIKAIIHKYQKLPRVKIPLEFDEKGEPSLADR